MIPRMSKRTLALLGMIVCVALWSLAPIAGKYLFDEGAYSPALLIGIRGAVAVLVLGLFLLLTKRFSRITRAYWVCLPAGLILGLAYLLQFIGLSTTPLSKNTFLESFSVLAVPLCMFLFVREKPTVASLFAAVFCFFGCFVLCGKGMDFSAFFQPPTLGEVFSALGGAFFGANIAFTKVFAKKLDPFIYVFFQMIVMTAMSFLYAIPFEADLAFSFAWNHVLVALFLALFCTVGCWLLRTVCIRHVSALTTVVLNPMSAVLATVLSVLLGMEEFSWNVVIGGAIITLSILVSGILDARAEAAKKQTKTPEEKPPLPEGDGRQ